MWLYIWLGVIAVGLLMEAMTTTLTSIWFSVGGVAALVVASFFPEEVVAQSLAFIAVSGLAIFLLRPLARKSMAVRRTATNADRVLGMVGLVTEEIDNVGATGVVQVGGKTWTARSADETRIPMGARVDVLRIEGVKLIVSKSNTPSEDGRPCEKEKTGAAR